MRNLIYVAVIVHVAFTAAGLKLQGKEVRFGDMIAYDPNSRLLVKFQHFAIFVGNKFPGQGNIFERTKEDCSFSTLDRTRGPVVFNVLDGCNDANGKRYRAGNWRQIRARILEKKAECGSYNPLTNNCEHLATYVRYGQAMSMQHGMTGAPLLCATRAAADVARYAASFG